MATYYTIVKEDLSAEPVESFVKEYNKEDGEVMDWTGDIEDAEGWETTTLRDASIELINGNPINPSVVGGRPGDRN